MKIVSAALVAAAVVLGASTLRAADEPGVKKVLTLNAAMKIAAAAQTEASRRGATVVIAVVDDGGNLIVLHRLDDTQVASVEVGIGKARTAAIFRRPSKEFEDQIRSGRVAALALPGATPLQGGVPITVDGKVVGAIGVSGNTRKRTRTSRRPARRSSSSPVDLERGGSHRRRGAGGGRAGHRRGRDRHGFLRLAGVDVFSLVTTSAE